MAKRTDRPKGVRGLAYSPRNPRQVIVRERWGTTKLFVLTGPAGTGKTTAALAEALADVFAGRSRKVYLSRPQVTADEDMGFLPGDLTEKFRPWLQPFADVLGDLSDATLESLDDVVEMVPVGLLRGRTFRAGTLIVDECQNCTLNQLKLAGSRFGGGGRVVLSGDLDQTDIPWDGEIPLARTAKRVAQMRHGWGQWVQFQPADQLRDEGVTEFLRVMK